MTEQDAIQILLRSLWKAPLWGAGLSLPPRLSKILAVTDMHSKFTYVGIRVIDVQRSVDFYTNILGMQVIGRSKMPQTKGETVAMQSEKDGFILELNYYEKDSPHSTPYVAGCGLDHLAFKVDNLDETLEEATKAGHPPALEMKANNNRWAFIEDPNGIWIELF